MSPHSPLTPSQVLAPGGVLSRLMPDYEPRPAQVDMAEQVAAALAEHRALLCEAGTGTGKTLAYLVPAILSGQRVVISTGTRHLQEQLFHKDLPLLERALISRFTAVRLKGISNYLCLRRFDEARRQPQPPPGLDRIIDWQARTEVGDRAEIADLGDDAPEWLAVSATSETRLGGRCPFFEQCYVTRARRAAQGAELIIVNHHLLCADLAIRARFPEARLLPPYDALICDEAHQLEEIATDYFGTSVSSGRVHALLRDLRTLGASAAAHDVEVHSQRLFAALLPPDQPRGRARPPRPPRRARLRRGRPGPPGPRLRPGGRRRRARAR